MRGLCVALLILGVCSSAANAQQADANAQARAHFRAGTAFYEAGDYDRAIEEFLAARKLLPLPDFLFNLGQAYRLKGDPKTAADYYQHYLAEKPTGVVADQARAHLLELQPSLKTAAATLPVSTSPSSLTKTSSASAPSTAASARAGAVLPKPAPMLSRPSQPPTPAARIAVRVTRSAEWPLAREAHSPLHASPGRSHRRLYVAVGLALGAIAAIAVGLGVGLGVGLSSNPPAATFGSVPVQ